MSGISTHVLDTTRGQPAAGVAVTLERLGRNDNYLEPWRGLWTLEAEATTDPDGRIKPLVAEDKVIPGIYRLTFLTGDYFAALQQPTLYPEITVTFSVREGERSFHIPLLLNAFGYTTYRGS